MDKKMITTIIAVFFAIVVGVIGVTYAVAPSNDSVAYDDSDDDDDYDDDYRRIRISEGNSEVLQICWKQYGKKS